MIAEKRKEGAPSPPHVDKSKALGFKKTKTGIEKIRPQVKPESEMFLGSSKWLKEKVECSNIKMIAKAGMVPHTFKPSI